MCLPPPPCDIKVVSQVCPHLTYPQQVGVGVPPLKQLTKKGGLPWALPVQTMDSYSVQLPVTIVLNPCTHTHTHIYTHTTHTHTYTHIHTHTHTHTYTHTYSYTHIHTHIYTHIHTYTHTHTHTHFCQM